MEKNDKKVKSTIRRRRIIGIVVSDKNDKTIKVQIESLVIHPLYNKHIRKNKIITVHDEKNVAKVGDKVEIIESRPISRLKKWRLVKIVEKAK